MSSNLWMHVARQSALTMEDGKTVMVERKIKEAFSNNETKPDPDWHKLLLRDLKKIHVEDLGHLSAQELWNTVPEKDKEG
jgi:hypothetical protein